MTKEKELVALTLDPFIPGAEVTIPTDVKGFAEGDISSMFVDDPWWGVIDLTLETYNAVTYAAYTIAAPPAWGQIMFNADRTAFKCGTAVWMGKMLAMIIPVGSRVLVS